eukprot:m.164713 g.164713  ORF g.164713 m.164713 type:complete len:125 (+) comp17719_c0_seq7:1538-1912(+)
MADAGRLLAWLVLAVCLQHVQAADWPPGSCNDGRFSAMQAAAGKCSDTAVGDVRSASNCQSLCLSLNAAFVESEFCQQVDVGFGESTNTYCLCATTPAGLTTTTDGCGKLVSRKRSRTQRVKSE